MADRKNFGKLKDTLTPPNLIEIQINSYLDFLQKDAPIQERKNDGLEAVSYTHLTLPTTPYV